MKKLFIYTNIPSHYREVLWTELINTNDFNVHFFFGENKTLGIKQINFTTKFWSRNKNRLHNIRNYWYRGKVLFWQKGVISRCYSDKFDIAIFLGDFYCISTWVAALICKIRNIKIVFWGHGFYGNESNIKIFLRKTFFRLADNHLLYERRAKSIMINYGFRESNIYVIFNSLNYYQHLALRKKLSSSNKNDLFPFFQDKKAHVLIFIGRLTKIKKLDMLITAVNILNNSELSVNLLIIGNGNERVNLERIAHQGIKEKRIYFLGESYSEEEIGRFLYNSDLCVSPGNIGLTAIHSLSFGTPICTHNNLNNQMPEAEIIESGKNGFYFNENDTNDLVEKIKIWLSNDLNRELIREQCYKMIDKYYNPKYQKSVFKRLFENKLPEI